MAWIDPVFRSRIWVAAFSLFFVLVIPAGSYAAEQSVPGQEQAPPAPQGETAGEFRRFRIEFEPDAYYTNLGLYVALTSAPIPYLGEKTEKEIYRTLLSRFFTPRFLVLEASVNPLPYLGAYTKKTTLISMRTPSGLTTSTGLKP
jgi:hypothetical protein